MQNYNQSLLDLMNYRTSGPSTVKIVSEKGFLKVIHVSKLKKLDARIDGTTDKVNGNRDPGFKQTETHQSDQTKITLVTNQPQVLEHSKPLSSEEISRNGKEIKVKSKHKLKNSSPPPLEPLSENWKNWKI
ncbi:hypothetical protein RFI_38374 [Reticulomyxa filosa]|uniref:Uncharacterized protein n=1 Tax=Reticulomyxa filosa TaxID=46433 RepID=X6LC40_RETFI|nr:hypothetical protein RFI_38374 [Reticulomyxa filosa]|eukprot:ETN99113.1 hypothetical protein RFI_38374 [Reticulomyxa filosa]